MSQDDFSKFLTENQPKELVTPLKRRVPDGRLFERTGEKRLVLPGDWHWCNGTAPSPELVTLWNGSSDRPCENCGKPDRDHYIDRHTDGSERVTLWCQSPHVCPIWKLADNQDEEETLFTPPAELPRQSIDELIDRIGLTREAVEDGDVPMLTRASVLAALHQAKQLERIAAALESIAPYYTSFPLPASPKQTAEFNAALKQAESRNVCSMCNHGEHAKCQAPDRNVFQCECPICHQGPENPSQFRHSFEGMEDNHFCTLCGAGRLHSIHQANAKRS